MKKLIFNAKTCSSLALFCLITNYSLVLNLNDYASTVRHLILPEMLLCSPLGMILSGLLSPLFLASPGRNKSKLKGILFILILLIPNIILRSFGFELWLSSVAVRSIIAFLTGMLYPPCAGLFIYSFLDDKNKTGKNCVLIFSVILSFMLITRVVSLSLLESLGITNSFDIAKDSYHIIICLIACTGILSVFSVVFMRDAKQSAAKLSAAKLSEKPSGWRLIFIIIGLSVVYQILNVILELRLLSLTIIYTPGQNIIYFLIVAVIVVIMGFLAGLSIQKFLRIFLPAAAILIFLLPCLVLFNTNPPVFIVILQYFTGSVIYRTAFAVFTIVVVEAYLSRRSTSGRNGYWFFMLAGYYNAISFVLAFSHKINALVPQDSGYTVLIVSIASVIFMILSIRIIFPIPSAPERVIIKEIIREPVKTPAPLSGNMQEIFTEHNLSAREIDVAALLINEGLGTKEIADRLCISPHTVKDHLKHIFQKFNVKKRSEFISLFVDRPKF